MSPAGLTLRELWWMAGGRRYAVRQQTLWQAAALLADKLNQDEFLRRGVTGAASGSKVTMSPSLRRKVDEEIRRLNREQHGQSS